MNLEEIVPWGRNKEEYISMFNLTNEDNILGIADGPASFAKEMRDIGKYVISSDIIYKFKAFEIERKMQEVLPIIKKQMQESKKDFNFKGMFSSVEDLISSRLKSMNIFLKDYELHTEYYNEASVLDLPYIDKSFDLALVSHFLFLYSEHLDISFHIQAIKEILRVSKCVRIFPLTDLGGQISPHLDGVQEAFKEYNIDIVRCSYDFVKGADSYLEISEK